MPRQKSLIVAIRDLVRQEVGRAIQAMLSVANPKAKNGRRRRRRRSRRGPGRPRGSKNKTA